MRRLVSLYGSKFTLGPRIVASVSVPTIARASRTPTHYPSHLLLSQRAKIPPQTPNMTPPIPELSAGPEWSSILRTLYLFLRLTPQLFFLLIIFSNISPGSDLFSNGINFHFQRDPVIEREPCLSLFIFLNILYIATIIRGYRSVRSSLGPLSNDEEKNANSTMVAKLRALLKGRHYDVRREFASYLANPFDAFPSPSRFSRREQAWSISMMVVLNLMIARLPFREWSKIDS